MLTVSQFVVMGINMINVMVLSRFRTLEEYGTYSQIIMVCTIVITFFSAGFSQCINYFLGKCDSEEKKQFIKNYYTIVTFVGVAGGLVTLFLLPFIRQYFENNLMARYWFVLLLYPISHILNSGIDRFFIAYQKSRWLFAFRVGHSALVLSEAFLAVLFEMSFYHYMIVYIMVEIVFSAFTYVWIRMITGTVPFGFNKKMIKSILTFAVPMAVASLVSTINTEMDKLIVGGFVNTEMLAIYTNAARELPVYIFSTSISSVTMPFIVKKVAKRDYSDAVMLWRKSITLCFYIVCFCVCVLFAFAPQIIDILYSEKYISGTPIFRIYSMVLLFRVTYYGMVLNSLGKTKTILKASIVTMIINLVLDIILYKLLGLINAEVALMGPAIATLVSVSVMNIYQLVLTKREIGVKFIDIYPVKTLIKILFVNVMLAVAIYFVQQVIFGFYSNYQNVTTILLGCVWLLAYMLIAKKQILKLWKELNESR